MVLAALGETRSRAAHPRINTTTVPAFSSSALSSASDSFDHLPPDPPPPSPFSARPPEVEHRINQLRPRLRLRQAVALAMATGRIRQNATLALGD
jgi:hypothetical protein